MRVLERLFDKSQSIYDNIPMLSSGLPGMIINDQDPTQQAEAMLGQISALYAKNLEKYEALVSVVINCPELVEEVSHSLYLFNDIDSQLIDADVQPHRLELSEDSYHDILSAFLFACDDNESGVLSFTDSDGYMYALSAAGDIGYGKPLCGVNFNRVGENVSIPFMWIENGKYFISTIIFPVNYEIAEDENVGLGSVVPVAGLIDVSLTGDVSALASTTLRSRVDVALQHHNLSTTGTIFGDIAILGDLYSESVVNIGEGLTDIYTDVEREHGTPTHVVSNNEIKSTNHVFSLWGWISSLAVSSSINDALSSLCSAVGSLNITEKIRSLCDSAKMLKSKCSSAAEYVYTHASNAYAETGLQGLLNYISGYFKRQQSLINRDGTLRYTDNSLYVPREFIVGFTSTLFFSAVEMISYVVTLAWKAVGVVLNVLSTIGQTVYTMLAETIQNSAVAFNFPECLSGNNNSHMILNASPLSIYRGEILVGEYVDSTSWMYKLFTNDPSVRYLHVPGGLIIMGPGSFSSTGQVSTIKWEFHPSSFLIKKNFNLLVGLSNTSIEMLTHHNQYSYKAGHWVWQAGQKSWFLFDVFTGYMPDADVAALWTNPKYISSLWVDILKNWSDDAVVKTDGPTDSKDVDNQTGYGAAIASAIFLAWVNCFRVRHDRYYPLDAPVFLDMGACLKTFNKVLYAAKTYLGAWNIDTSEWYDWNTLVQDFVDIQDLGMSWGPVNVYDMNGNDMLLYVVPNGGTAFLGPTNEEASLMFKNVNITNLTSDNGVYNTARLSRDFKFAYLTPLWNARTKWKWFATACAVLAVTVALTVVATITVKRTIRRLRAGSVARAAGAQSTYQDAVNGIKWETDPQTGELRQYEFDTKSPEGRAYIKSCYKDYCHVAFKNNLLANVIGGSKFDVSSFWGEKDTGDESSSIISRVINLTGQDSSDPVDILNAQGESYDESFSRITHLLNGESS